MSRRQWLLAAAGLIAGPGCASPQKVPASYLAGNRTVLIAPLKGAPLKLPSAFEMRYGDGARGGVGYLGALLFIVSLAGLPKTSSMRKIGVRDFEQWKEGRTWDSSTVLAQLLARKLSTRGRWRAVVRPGLCDPAGGKLATKTTMLPGAPPYSYYSWYGREGLLVPAEEVRQHGAGFVLEIGSWQMLSADVTLYLAVYIKAVDPATGAVLGRAVACRDEIKLPPLTELFDNEGEKFRSEFQKAVEGLLDDCVATLGL